MPEFYENLQPKQRRFLRCFETCDSLTQAARWAKIHRSNHYQWLEESPEYKAAFVIAEERARRTLEDEAVRRAHQGLRKAIRYKGKIVGYETEYSDTLMTVLLKRDPKFRDRWSGELKADIDAKLDLRTSDAILTADDGPNAA